MNIEPFKTIDEDGSLINSMKRIAAMSTAAMSEYKIINLVLNPKDFPTQASVVMQSIVEIAARMDRIKLLEFDIKGMDADIAIKKYELEQDMKKDNVPPQKLLLIQKKKNNEINKIEYLMSKSESRKNNYKAEAKVYIERINSMIPGIPGNFIKEDGSIKIDELEMCHWEYRRKVSSIQEEQKLKIEDGKNGLHVIAPSEHK